MTETSPMPRRTTAAALLAALLLAACGQDGDADATGAATTPQARPDPQRYCALTRDLDARGERFFAGLGRDAGPEEFRAAERRFVERFAPDLRAVQAAAPAEIRDDVRRMLAAMRARAGLPGPRVTAAQATAAEDRIKAYEGRACDPDGPTP